MFNQNIITDNIGRVCIISNKPFGYSKYIRNSVKVTSTKKADFVTINKVKIDLATMEIYTGTEHTPDYSTFYFHQA